MKLCVLYHPHSDIARPVEEFIHEFQRVHNGSVEVLSLETREGAATASLYDIVQYPAIMALTDSGSVLQLWSGPQLPLMNEVAAYLAS